MSNPATYRTDHSAAEEINALAALLAEVVEYTTSGATYLGQLRDVAEAARQHESVQRQLAD